MSEDRRGGERRRACARSACTGCRHERSCRHSAGASFARSFDPCRSPPHSKHEASQAHRGGAFDSVSRLGKPTRVGGTSTGAERNGRCAARRVSPLPRGRGRATSEKEGGRGLRPCEDQELRFVARTSCFSCKKSVSIVWASNKLGTRAPKRAAGSSERGPSSERSRRATVGRCLERTERCVSASPAQVGGASGTGSRVTRERHPAVATSPQAVQ
jgi:hypothetical protein